MATVENQVSEIALNICVCPKQHISKQNCAYVTHRFYFLKQQNMEITNWHNTKRITADQMFYITWCLTTREGFEPDSFTVLPHQNDAFT